MPLWLLNWRVWAAAGIAAMALYAYVQTVRLGGCQAELRGANDKLAVLGAQIEAQNAAVTSLELAGRAKIAEAAKAASEARQRNAGLTGQVSTLTKSLEAAQRDPGKTQQSACPAGDAVKEVRRALAGR